MDSQLISVIPIHPQLWKVVIHIPCQHLIEEEGLFKCAILQKKPESCRLYPLQFVGQDPLIIEAEKQICPHILDILNQSK